MSCERFFTQASLHLSETITLSGDEFHHLHRVMRLQLNASLEVINGKGQLGKGFISSLYKDHALITLIEVSHEELLSSLTLALALPRFNRLEYVVEKATELGINHFVFFPALGSEKKKLSPNQWERLDHLILAALKQCNRLHKPTMTFLQSLQKWPIDERQALFFGDTDPHAPSFLQKPLASKEASFFIGPEKGFTEEEMSFLKHTLKAQAVSLNSHVLRVDTAAIVAAAFMQ